MAKHDELLFDPATRERIRADTARGVIAVFAGVTLVGAALTGAMHHELPVLAWAANVCSPEGYAYECPRAQYNVVAGAIGLVFFAGVSVLAYRYRRIRPTVECRSCGGRGWVMDLEPREGRCPRCAGSRFTYRTRLASGGPLGPTVQLVHEPETDGAALVRRFRETRKSLFDRYY